MITPNYFHFSNYMKNISSILKIVREDDTWAKKFPDIVAVGVRYF